MWDEKANMFELAKHPYHVFERFYANLSTYVLTIVVRSPAYSRQVVTLGADVMALCVARPSADMILTLSNMAHPHRDSNPRYFIHIPSATMTK